MRRRTLLTGLGTSVVGLLAGCNAPTNNTTAPTEQPPSDNNTSSQDQSSLSTYKPRYYVSGLTFTDDEIPLEYETQRVTNKGEPLAFDITLKNVSDNTLWVGDVQDLFFEQVTPEDDSVYKLFPPLGDNQFEKSDYCWTATDYYGQDDSFQQIKLDPDESETQRVYLAARTDAECVYEKPFSLTFRTTVQYSSSPTQQVRTATTAELILFYAEAIK